MTRFAPVLLQTGPVLPDLSTGAGRAELERAAGVVAAVTETDPVRRTAAVRRLLDADLGAAALALVELRSRAREKFGADADRLFFTGDGLEQSTRAELADHRAARFAAAGRTAVLDLCCGIGADAWAFARAGLQVTGVERDPQTAAVARADAAVLGLSDRIRIEVGDAEASDWAGADSVFCDPARRGPRGRTANPADYSPSFGFVRQLLAGAGYAAVKLAPGLDHRLIPDGVEAEWVSFGGGVKEAVLWSAGFATGAVRRRGTVLPGGGSLTDADAREEAVGDIGDYLYEPDGALIRAGLVQQVAATLPGGRRIDEHLAYLSADAGPPSPWARGFRVLNRQPFSVRRLRAELRSRGVGIVEIKKRGVDVDPAALRRELAPQGPNSLTVLLARVGERRIAILAEPLR